MDNYSLESLLTLDAVQFENLVNMLLTKMGLIASTTKRSGDGGVDIIATNEQPILGGKYVIQCKRYAPGNKVGEPAVRELFGVMMHENANKGILITTSDFSRQAKSFSRNKAIELLNGDSILSLLNKHLYELPSVGYLPTSDCIDERREKVRAHCQLKFILSDLTVRDIETGLEWVRDANLSVLPLKWQEAGEFIKNHLNNTLFAGYSDWILPTIENLRSLWHLNIEHEIVFYRYFPGILTEIGFMNIQQASYWFPLQVQKAII